MTTHLQKMSPKDLAQFIDHTLLKPDATKTQIRQLCEEALQHQFYAVCVNSSMIATSCEILKSTKIKIASVVGFPLGANEPSTKSFETTRAFNLGAHEVDMVINIGALKAKEYLYVEKEIADVVRAAAGNVVKVILETSLLNEEEKIKACEISMHAGAQFVKTSTGFGGGGATIDDIKLMKKIVGPKGLVKASGGIKNFAAAKELIDAGANRLGTSSGVVIISGLDVKAGY